MTPMKKCLLEKSRKDTKQELQESQAPIVIILGVLTKKRLRNTSLMQSFIIINIDT